MPQSLAIAIAQIDPTVGDMAGNVTLIRRARAEAAALGAQVVVTGETSVTGYPAEDLVLKPLFVDQARESVERLAAETADGGPADPSRLHQREPFGQASGMERGRTLRGSGEAFRPDHAPAVAR